MTPSKDRPIIIPVFIPHSGCSHQCVFCNQQAITSVKANHLSPDNLYVMIEKALDNKGEQKRNPQIAFYGGNFLGLETDHIMSLLQVAARFVSAGKVDSVRFSTRPDTIYKEKIGLLRNFPISIIELGAQSMDDNVLALVVRIILLSVIWYFQRFFLIWQQPR